ncbi:MAG: transcription-repair coupling factor, partial [Bacteroidales bacterium]|nr:transcription-repair coupling factor [Bacteroidales bacterium]
DMGFETYQKILSEAMEELGVEAGMAPKQGRGTYHTDCTIETDQQALIPDSYIDITAEKIRIYKQLDSLFSDKEIDLFALQLRDRFGILPTEVENLLEVVKIRNAGARLGFEKIIVKNGMFIAFFISNQMSPYFRSDTFSTILDRVNTGAVNLEFKQSEGKLKLITRKVDSLQKARAILSKLE